ncbi:MAG: protease inhibitor I42 family protein [Hyphomonas sp.]|jgi:predicted secreted protein|nr:protease inhibitor I42 family protein [Henriciella sp.]MBO6695430.1 protease inhibitor I42 family protein [Henriciella sp.]MCR9223828.1 protease inhibitor I42 family protein [Hyphomonas sp.]
MKRAMALILGAGLLTACIPDIMNTQPEVRGLEGAAPVQTFTDPENGTTVTMRPGGKLNLKLDSNPTTGYYWYLKDIDASRVDQLSEDYFADPAPEGLTGSGGHQMFVFEALQIGKSDLVLSYERSPQDVAETLKLKIKVVE